MLAHHHYLACSGLEWRVEDVNDMWRGWYSMSHMLLQLTPTSHVLHSKSQKKILTKEAHQTSKKTITPALGPQTVAISDC